MCVYLSIYLSTYLSIYLSISCYYLHYSLFVSVFLHLSLSLSIHCLLISHSHFRFLNLYTSLLLLTHPLSYLYLNFRFSFPVSPTSLILSVRTALSFSSFYLSSSHSPSVYPLFSHHPLSPFSLFPVPLPSLSVLLLYECQLLDILTWNLDTETLLPLNTNQ